MGSLVKAFAYLIAGLVVMGAAVKEVVGSFLVSGPLETLLGVNPWIFLAIFIIGLGLFLSGIYEFIMAGLALLEKKLHYFNSLRYRGSKKKH